MIALVRIAAQKAPVLQFVFFFWCRRKESIAIEVIRNAGRPICKLVEEGKKRKRFF